jgi:hypothetical protein
VIVELDILAAAIHSYGSLSNTKVRTWNCSASWDVIGNRLKSLLRHHIVHVVGESRWMAVVIELDQRKVHMDNIEANRLLHAAFVGFWNKTSARKRSSAGQG